MPFDSRKSVQDHLINVREMTQDDLAAVSGGKPAKNPHTETVYMKIVITDATISSY